MVFNEYYLSNHIKGAIAEKLFEMMHLELGCQVFRTGHEHLFPHLFHIANKKKQLFNRYFGGEEIERIRRELKEQDKNYSEENHIQPLSELIYMDDKMEKKESEIALASSSDFTIISPRAEIRQFEVKYRWNGKLEDEQIRKYLSLQYPPFIFIFMSVKPFIKILEPVNYKKPKKESDIYPGGLAVPKKILNYGWDDLYGYYEELQKNEDSSFVIKDEIGGIELVYNSELIAKYSKIIEDYYGRFEQSSLGK